MSPKSYRKTNSDSSWSYPLETYKDEEFENSGVAQHAAPELVHPATKRSHIFDIKHRHGHTGIDKGINAV